MKSGVKVKTPKYVYVPLTAALVANPAVEFYRSGESEKHAHPVEHSTANWYEQGMGQGSSSIVAASGVFQGRTIKFAE